MRTTESIPGSKGGSRERDHALERHQRRTQK
jgi:hypothetical protein